MSRYHGSLEELLDLEAAARRVLTQREREVLFLMLQGYEYIEIAEILDVSKARPRQLRETAMRKLRRELAPEAAVT